MMKGYKITNSEKTKIVGIACKSLSELIKKGKEKLKINYENLSIALEDGTLVQDEEYFTTLPAQTLFIIYKPNETIISGVDVILNALRSVNSSYLNVSAAAAEAMTEKAQELTQLITNSNLLGEPLGNTPDTDPDWFSGLETNAKTKEEFMFKKAQDRLRGYLYKLQADVKKSENYKDAHFRKMITDCLDNFKKRLVLNLYYGCYFDRRCAAVDSVDSSARIKKKLKLNIDNEDEDNLKSSYCNQNGLFSCGGLWKMNYCTYNTSHFINPYLNAEARVIFSTWNLDHRIEKSRTILPALLTAVKSSSDKIPLNYDYFYGLLFTKSNLKLVHIACHDKGGHNISCDSSQFFISS